MPKMDDTLNAIEFHQWNRKILNAYWLVLIISIVGELAGALFIFVQQSRPLGEYLLYSLLLPTAVVTVTIAAAEWINRSVPAWSNYWLITTGTVIAAEYVAIQPKVNGIHLAFILPLLASVFYFQWRKVLFSYGLNVLAVLVIFGFSQSYSYTADWREMVSALTVMTCGVVLTLGIMSRGAEIQRYLVRTMQEQQELLVRNTMMEKLSKTDALTELYNHKTFHGYLDKLIEQSERTGMKLQLALIDIDNFKKINDTFGHWVGDLILRRVADGIRHSLAADDFAARYGGEEFAVIVADKSDETAYRAAESIRLAIAGERHDELNGHPVTVSIGVCAYETGLGKEALFKGADAALYEAKRGGKNRTIVGGESYAKAESV
ncbi:GGDEF domain-containing protein [Paenibacillus cymbidii]|uniref:GGDEF domain-containing protein n=1 Tax=Paenibacillus cymbidii TaxID=1639034 RepID=UPI0010801F38|nr:GGDEF domain-containing protein [Paenibacillus cymbidii]